MLTELFEKYGNQKPMDLGTAVERTIPVSAVIKMMEEYHEGKVKNLDILHVIKCFNRKEEFLEILWKTKKWFEQNPTGLGGYSEKYCKEKLKSWVEENIL